VVSLERIGVGFPGSENARVPDFVVNLSANGTDSVNCVLCIFTVGFWFCDMR